MDWQRLMIRWTLLLLLLLLPKIPAISPLNCPEGCGVCRINPSGIQEIDCITGDSTIFKLQINPENNEIRLDCQLEKSTNWSDLNLGKSAPFEAINSLSFNYCDLPDDNRLEILARQLLSENVETLEFRSFKNLSSRLENVHLRGFPGLKKLSLFGNNFTKLPENLLQNFPNLTNLDLRENNIRYLPGNFFSSNLRVLDLSDNRIESFDAKTFEKLDKLQSLNIFNNKVVKILPRTFDNLVSLETLDIQSNYLKALPFDVFSRLENLKNIYLSENNFTLESFTSELFRNNKKLEILTLKENRINVTSLPDGFFANLTSLTHLDLRKNGFIYLPEDLFWGAEKLGDITLGGNYLSTLPSHFFRDSNYLLTLDLSFNQLHDLPDDLFSSLHKLEKLDLSGNRISNVSKDLFAGLSSLQELNMESNDLTTIHFLAFNFVKKLRIAKFSYNALTLRTMDLQPVSPFQPCTALEELHLSHNRINTVYQDWNVNLVSLRVLNLTYNRLQYLRLYDLQFLAAKEDNHVEVDYSSNNISFVDMRFAELVATGDKKRDWLTISIENNPLRCDCSLYDLLRFLENRVGPDVYNSFYLKIGDLRCFSPEDYRGIPILDLSSEKLVCGVNSPGLPHEIFCPDKCDCYLRPEDKAILTNCANRALTTAPQSIGSYLSHHNELYLSGNLLTEMPDFNLPGYEYVDTLDLDNNKISTLSVDRLSNNLKVLHLKNNNLTRLDVEVIDFLRNSSSLSNLTLQGNPWICDCDARDFLSFIQARRTKLPDLLKIRCEDSVKSISEMTPEEMCPLELKWIIVGCLVLAFFGVLIGSLVALYWRYQHELKMWLYSRQWCLKFIIIEDETEKDKRYDAFISCSPDDEEFVANNLMAKLEEGPRPFKVCMHYRDFSPGEWILTQIVNSIQESRRTIIVLSPSFLQSVWGSTEFREAHKQALTEGQTKVIIVLYGDIGPIEDLDNELKTYLTMNTYVKWGDPWFWEKLKYALPHSPMAEVISRDIKRSNIFENTQLRLRTENDKSESINLSPVAATIQ